MAVWSSSSPSPPWVSAVTEVVEVVEPAADGSVGKDQSQAQNDQMGCEERTCRDIISFAIDIGGLCCRS